MPSPITFITVDIYFALLIVSKFSQKNKHEKNELVKQNILTKKHTCKIKNYFI